MKQLGVLCLFSLMACGSRTGLSTDPDASGPDSGLDIPDVRGPLDRGFADVREPLDRGFADVPTDQNFPDLRVDAGFDARIDIGFDSTIDAAFDMGRLDLGVDAATPRDYCPLNEPFPFDPDPDPVDVCPERCFTTVRGPDPCVGQPTVMGTILSDTVWDGLICVGAEVGIRRGVTLRILPGSEVHFSRGAGIRVEGNLEASGSEAAPILFTSRQPEPKRADWQGISVYLSDGGTATVSNATIEYANIGLATWESSPPSMVGPEITVSVRQVLFQFNNTAVTPDDNSDVSLSTVVCNNQGIFVASEDTPVQLITENNICDNLEWGMAAIQDDADARNNYWCTTDLMEIMDTVRDEADDISLGGLINVEPFRSSPVPQAPPIPQPR